MERQMPNENECLLIQLLFTFIGFGEFTHHFQCKSYYSLRGSEKIVRNSFTFHMEFIDLIILLLLFLFFFFAVERILLFAIIRLNRTATLYYNQILPGDKDISSHATCKCILSFDITCLITFKKRNELIQLSEQYEYVFNCQF